MCNLFTSLLFIIPVTADLPTEPVTVTSQPGNLSVGPVDVAPSGWRRTVRGWERAEHWPVTDAESQAVTLHRVIERQRNAELAWVGGRGLSTIMKFVRSIDPVTLLCSQITLLAVYIALVFHRESKNGNPKCPTTSKLFR